MSCRWCKIITGALVVAALTAVIALIVSSGGGALPAWIQFVSRYSQVPGDHTIVNLLLDANDDLPCYFVADDSPRFHINHMPRIRNLDGLCTRLRTIRFDSNHVLARLRGFGQNLLTR